MAKITGVEMRYHWGWKKVIYIATYESGFEKMGAVSDMPKTLMAYAEKHGIDYEMTDEEREDHRQNEIKLNPFGIEACKESIKFNIEILGEDPNEMMRKFLKREKEDMFFNKNMTIALEYYMEEHSIENEAEAEPDGDQTPTNGENSGFQEPTEAVENVTDVIGNYDGCSVYAEYICDYNGETYWDDAVSEIADNSTSIYYTDIYKFLSENVDAVEEAIDEFGWDGVGSSLVGASQMAEFGKIRNELYENAFDVACVYAFNFYRDKYGEYITTDIRERIEDKIDNYGTPDRLEELENVVTETVEAMA